MERYRLEILFVLAGLLLLGQFVVPRLILWYSSRRFDWLNWHLLAGLLAAGLLLLLGIWIREQRR